MDFSGYRYEKGKRDYEEKENTRPLQYPEVYIPYDAYLISRKCPDVPRNLYEPCKPEEPTSFSESPPKFVSKLTIVSIISTIVSVISIGIFVSSKNSFFGSCAILSMFAALITLNDALRDYLAKKREYANKLKSYEYKLKRYDREMEEYKTELADYEKNKDIYKAKIAEINSEENIIKYREELFEKQFRSNLSGFSRINAEYIKKGASELLFFHYLKSQFDRCYLKYRWNILTDAKVSTGINSMDFYADESAYYPDFVFVFGNLFIDIEIDEPYVGDSKKPIHHQYAVSTIEKCRLFTITYDKRKTRYHSIDEARNSFFLSNNWCVIRFAEEQIYTQPYECFLLVKKVAESIISYEGFPWSIDAKYLCIKPVKKWTEYGAKQMAALDYRDSYLDTCLGREDEAE